MIHTTSLIHDDVLDDSDMRRGFLQGSSSSQKTQFSPYHEILGEGFFADFDHVTDDESHHFAWCSQRLVELGFKYGDMPAHNLLWRECEKSSDNVAARLAAIPLVQVRPIIY